MSKLLLSKIEILLYKEGCRSEYIPLFGQRGARRDFIIMNFNSDILNKKPDTKL
jgi:hypothetical protein